MGNYIKMERATPLADEELSNEILEIITQSSAIRQLKRGANESTKTLKRENAELIVMAADATPLEIILHLPLLCEDMNVPYIFVGSKADLGQACGTTRNVVACAVTKNSNSSINEEVSKLKVKVEKCFYDTS